VNTPIPRDIPLPMPVNATFAEILLVVAFIAHILFVNLMVGGTVLVLGLQLRGRRDPDYDVLARLLGKTVTVNKSLAVVLGVAPLLILNVLYAIHFYTANALTGLAWILVIPLVTIAFLLIYLHKYTWESLAHARGVHIAINGFAAAILLFIPLVFLANVNLMLLPEQWTGVRGFFSAVALPNVLPRYFHFMSASLVLTSLFSVGYFGRESFEPSAHFEALDRAGIRRLFYGVAFAVSLLQFVIGPVVLVTVPSQGISAPMLSAIALGAALSVPAIVMMYKELTAPAARIRTRFIPIVTLLSLTVVCMASGRQMHRGIALAAHKAKMEARTAAWVDAAQQAAYDEKLGLARKARGESPGETQFKQTCAGCHAVDKVLVGPPLTEIARIYADDAEGIVRWALAPGQKRSGPKMPSMAVVGEKKLAQIAAYMLTAGTVVDAAPGAP
jgi:cytochrome c